MAEQKEIGRVLEKFGFGSQAGEAEKLLASYAALDSEGQELKRAGLIQEIFPMAFGENAILEKSTGYAEKRTSVWSTNCYLSPAVILTPETSEDVAKALVLCQFLDVKFSIRGGGHMQNPGFTSNEGGVVISMAKFRQLKVSKDKKTVDVGLGLTWSDVYNGLEPEGLAVTGGRIPTVGVPGLILGGGLSFQNSEYGLSCMGVTRYEVVLADGAIVSATEDENADLFWALKGGGPNFGVVTKIEMTAVPHDAWCEVRLIAAADSQKYLEELIPFSEAIESDTHASIIFNETKDVTVLVMFYTAAVDEKPEIFKPFYDLPYLMHLVPPAKRTLAQIVQAVKDVNQPTIPRCHDFLTMTSLPSLEVYKAAEEARLKTVEELKGTSVEVVMVIQPISSLMVAACQKHGGNPLGLKAKGQQWFLVEVDYEEQDEEKARVAGQQIIAAAEVTAKENGTYLPFKYSNYASRDQDPLASYGKENLQKLKEIAAKYDPSGVFQTLQNGGWLLSKVAAL